MGWGVWKIPLEEYLVYKLKMVMPEDYEKEALKAQAVLLRTEIVQTLWEEGSERLQVSGEGLNEWYETNSFEMEEMEDYQQAVKETDGLYLSYQGEPIQASYFKLSNGQTRDAEEMWESEKCPYLTSVACIQDKAAKDYSSVVSVSKVNYLYVLKPYMAEGYSVEDIWEGMQFSFDNTGYVTSVSFVSGENKIGEIDGETFRHLFNLPSASFEAEQRKRRLYFM